ncbi:MAG: hypothetical protein JXB10_18380 [Pirellulales bacterium]|nr:hypothetical protein [Pirellulales bacterium]
MIAKGTALVIFIILGRSASAFAATHLLLPPKPPQKAETPKEVAKVKAVIAEGVRQMKLIKSASRNRNNLFYKMRIRGLYLPRFSTYHKAVGNVGIIARAGGDLIAVPVVQIIDKDSILIESPRYLTIIGETPEDTREYDRKQLLLVKGFPTSGITNTDMVKFQALLEITGTKQYRTVDGTTNTVLVLKPFPLDIELNKSGIPKKRTNQKNPTNQSNQPKK